MLNGDGAGVFTPIQYFGIGSTRPTAAALVDIDGDGDLDILTANDGGNTVSVLVDDGAGGFTPRGQVSGLNSSRSIAMADGDLDALVANFNGGSVSVLKNNRAGVFPATESPTQP